MIDICIIYGGNSALIKKILPTFSKRFDKVVLISRKIDVYDKKIIALEYNLINDIFDELSILIQGNSVTFISAAAYSSDKLFVMENAETIDASIKVNVLNNIELIKFIINKNISLKKGLFIFISSFRSDVPTNGTLIYSASKKFIETLFNGLAIEYSRFHMRFVTLKIGLFEGGLVDKLPFDIHSEKIIKNNIASGRTSNAIDIVNALNFIIENEYLTGCEIDLTGKVKLDLNINEA